MLNSNKNREDYEGQASGIENFMEEEDLGETDPSDPTCVGLIVVQRKVDEPLALNADTLNLYLADADGRRWNNTCTRRREM